MGRRAHGMDGGRTSAEAQVTTKEADAMRKILILSASLALVPAAAHAHPGGPDALGLVDGVLHPLSGADHLAAAVLVGALSALPRIGARLAFAFMGGLAVGLVWGATAQIGAAGVELGVLVSLGALAAVFGLRRVPANLAGILGAAAGFVHGASQGVAGESLSPAFALGVVGTMAALLVVSRTVQSSWQHRRAK